MAVKGPVFTLRGRDGLGRWGRGGGARALIVSPVLLVTG